jgi:phosphoribosylanthranilate isomerase
MSSHRTWIKICGITRLPDALTAADMGVDALGFVFTPSPRRLDPEAARRIGRKLPPGILRIGVFVDETAAEITRAVAASEVDRVQVHAPPDPLLADQLGPKVLHSFRARDEGILESIRDGGEGTFLLDTYSPHAPGGTGVPFDWGLAAGAAKLGRLILAGGLTPENVARAIRDVGPWGVDVSSGVEESPGSKDPDRIRAFVQAVREADRARGAASDESTARTGNG